MIKEKFYNEVKEKLEREMPEYTVHFSTVTKENGITYEGVTVRPKSGNETVAPVLYLNKALEKVNNGENIAEVVEEIANNYINEMSASKYRKFDTESLLSFEDVKDKIFSKLINTAKNATLLEDRPHINVADLSKTFHIRIGEDASVPITNNLATKYGKTAEELDFYARENAKNTVKFGSMFSFLMGNGFDLDQATISDGEYPLYVVTNKDQMFGASMITYPEVCQKISDIFGGDYVILPSSIHEVIIIPANAMDKEDIYDMVRNVNETCVAQADFLSDNVYYYNSKEKKINFFK